MLSSKIPRASAETATLNLLGLLESKASMKTRASQRAGPKSCLDCCRKVKKLAREAEAAQKSARPSTGWGTKSDSAAPSSGWGKKTGQ